MGKFKNFFFYLTVIGGFSAMTYWISVKGIDLQAGRTIVNSTSGKGQWEDFLATIHHNLKHPLALLLAQIVTIIVVAKVFGWICSKIGQPSVIGEMIAGIVMGPSLVGMYFPEFSMALFPKESLGNLQFLSQIGLILFMFIVGMELDLKVLRNKANDAVVISHASIVIPFSLGIGLAYFVYQSFAPANVQFLSFGLFMGIAMSITAFPVLARIVQERGIHKTRLGTIVITCAAADDITAWCILAAVIAIVKAGSVMSSMYTILAALAYVVIMIKLVKPFLKRIGDIYAVKNVTRPIVAIFISMLIISAYVTEVIGIHALFGAFMAGAIMPESVKFRNIFIQKIEDVALVLLLPLFFVFTGLRTEIGLLNDIELWKMTGLIILVAVVGKFVGSALAARFVGQSWQDSLTIGALMNTRGLMELVVLNIGYDLGVLSPEIFAMMVIMALVTTFMTGPALDIINWAYKTTEEVLVPQIRVRDRYQILMSFVQPEYGRNLLRLANSLTGKLVATTSLTAIHVSSVDESHGLDVEEQEASTFQPISEEATSLDRQVTTLFKYTNDLEGEIANLANKGEFDLLLIGLGQSIYEGTFFGKLLGFTTRIINPEVLINKVTGKEGIFENAPFDERTRQILTKTQIPVGVFIDKEYTTANRVFVPLFAAEDCFLLDYGKKLIQNSGSQLVVMDVGGKSKNHAETKDRLKTIELTAPDNISILNQRSVEKEFLAQQDLMLISFESWKKLIESRSPWLSNCPSILVFTNSQSVG